MECLDKKTRKKEGMPTESGKLDMLRQVAAGIAAQFGSSCEVVIHDLSKHPDHTIVAIVNGHVSGRKVGDGASNVVMEQMQTNDQAPKDHLCYLMKTPDGKILKADVTVAKNYLSQEEMDYLERIVSLYLDYAELQARRKIPMSMEEWSRRLDGFLEFNGEKLLTGPGKISAEQAKLHAETEYEKYRLVQDRLYQSDFDRFLMLEQEVNHKDEV